MKTQWIHTYCNEHLQLVNKYLPLKIYTSYIIYFTVKSFGGAHGVMVVIVGNGHGDTSSNPGRDWLHFS